MKKSVIRLLFGFVSLCLFTTTAFAADMLVPVGRVIGLELYNDMVTVAAFDDSMPVARESGLQIGDEICRIDGYDITTAEDVRRALKESDGSVDVTVLRSGKERQLHMEPEITPDGPKLGVYLRQGITGIGTVTWYDPETGAFGTLGHGVNDGKGDLVEMTTGRAYSAGVLSVKRGKCGEPGQLRGSVDSAEPLGSLEKNTLRGVFGSTEAGWQGKAVEIASADEIQTGPAVICSTVSGDTVREYSVEILKIYPNSKADGRNMLLRVTDPALLSATGGIVQGMSGSPIIQDGKLVGAVTHVLVNDPTRGYGIFIENMLDAAA